MNEVYAGGGISNLALEEIGHDEGTGKWLITLAFSRTWNTPGTGTQEVLETVGGFVTPLKRAYEVITISGSGVVTSMKDRVREDSFA